MRVFSSLSSSDEKYPGHIPTNSFQKVLLSLGSSALTLFNPARGDMLALFGEASGGAALRRMKKKMEADVGGRRILQDRPVINTSTLDLERLNSLPEGTFGRTYHDWLEPNQAHPDERPPVEYVDDPDLAYVMRRYRENHDITHVILGMNTNMIGEVTVKVFEGLQTGLPMCVSGGVLGTFRLGPKHRKLYFETHLSYAIRQGLNANPFMNVYHEENWEMNLEELRKMLNVEAPPFTPKKKNRY